MNQWLRMSLGRLEPSLKRIRNELSLLRESSHVFGKGTGALLDACEGEIGRIVAVYPPEDLSLLESHLDRIRSSVSTSPGGDTIAPLALGERQYKGGFALHFDDPSKDGARRVFLVLSDEFYCTSVHLWPARRLKDEYCLRATLRKLTEARRELEDKDEQLHMSEAHIARELTPNTKWRDFVGYRKVASEHWKHKGEHKQSERPEWPPKEFPWFWSEHAVQRFGYRRREGAIEESEQGPRFWLKDETNELQETPAAEIAFLAMDLIEEDSTEKLHQKLADFRTRLGEVLGTITAEEFRARRALRRTLVVVLEHTARKLRQDAMQSGRLSSATKLDDFAKTASETLDLAALLVSHLLACHAGGKPGADEEFGRVSADDPVPEGELSREALRLWLVLRLASAKRLRQRYLDPANNREHRCAPAELKRAFITSLARYLLWIAGLIEARLDLHPDARAVNSGEVLDSLLHLVDRYVHVELELDERFDVRGRLAAAIEGEVRLRLDHGRHRDHLVHAIDVFLLGDLLLETRVRWLGGRERSLAEHFCALPKGPEVPHTRDDCHRLWALASLLHDIGSQVRLWRAPSAGPTPPWCRFFALPDTVTTHEIAPREQDDLEDCLNRLATGTGTGHGNESDWWQAAYDENLTDHGVVSALRVAQIAAAADANEGSIAREEGLPPLLAQVRPALSAIAAHNLAGRRLLIETEPLSCLLLLCDELQEWGRPRVNISRLVRGLFLDILDTPSSGSPGLDASDVLDRVAANIQFASRRGLCSGGGGAIGAGELCVVPQVRSEDRQGLFRFRLRYRKSTDASFDVIINLLCKAYRLQFIDLAADVKAGHADLRWQIDLQHPIPEEYGQLSEYDIYGLFTERVRDLPLLHEFQGTDEIEAGLIRLRHTDGDESGQRCDRFGIVLSRRAQRNHRHGWIPFDPKVFFAEFSAFKAEMFRGANSAG
ncbi:MAG: hypothetical protein ABIO70_05755 [Pseudomonadota bacterium]